MILTYLTWDIIQYDILNCKRFLKKMSKCGGENQLVIQFDKGGYQGLQSLYKYYRIGDMNEDFSYCCALSFWT